MDFKSHIRVVPDYPKPGISFKDITTLLKNGKVFQEAILALKEQVAHHSIDYVLGPEARGFVIGAPLAFALGVGFIPARKSGKLPSDHVELKYDLEYGKDTLSIHKDALSPGDRVLIADDLLATGGTIKTCLSLVESLGANVVGAAFLIELSELKGRAKLGDLDICSLLHFSN